MTVRVMFVEVFNAHGMVNVKQKLAPHKEKKKTSFCVTKLKRCLRRNIFCSVF